MLSRVVVAVSLLISAGACASVIERQPQAEGGWGGAETGQAGSIGGTAGTPNTCPQSCKEIEYDMYTLVQHNRSCTTDAECDIVSLRCLYLERDQDGQLGIRKDFDTSELNALEQQLEGCIQRTEQLDEADLRFRRCAQRALAWYVHCVAHVCRLGGL